MPTRHISYLVYSSKLTNYPPRRALPTQGLSANQRMAHKIDTQTYWYGWNPQSEPAPAEALYPAVIGASLTIRAERCTPPVPSTKRSPLQNPSCRREGPRANSSLTALSKCPLPSRSQSLRIRKPWRGALACSRHARACFGSPTTRENGGTHDRHLACTWHALP